MGRMSSQVERAVVATEDGPRFASASRVRDQGPRFGTPSGARDELFIASGRANLATTTIYGVIASAMTTALYLHADYPVWRVAVPLVLFVAMVAAQLLTLRRLERSRHGVGPAVACLHGGAQLYLVAVIAVTGGIHSPSLTAIGAAIAMPAVFFGRQPASRALMGSQVVLFAIMALLPARWLGPALPHGHHAAIAVIIFAWTVLMIYSFIGRLQDAAQEAAAAVDDLRDEQVAASSEQLCRLQSVGAKVAHELKNPLASIKGLVQLVARAPEGARSRERLAVVQAEVARMEEILAEYLSFSRPLEDLRPQPIDLVTVASDAAAVVAGRLEHGGLTLRVDGKRAPLEADPRRLKEALLNLLANAIEATLPGGSIIVAVEALAAGGARLVIRDSGRGIPRADLDRLGTTFFTTRDGGTGLGVVLAQTAIAQHGGTLRYASEVGRGTTVTIELPARPPSTVAAPPAALEPAA
jgi:signal transduction histidine kinase